MSDKPLVVACIPAFNEERTIGGAVVLASSLQVARGCFRRTCFDGVVDDSGARWKCLGVEFYARLFPWFKAIWRQKF